MFHVFQARRHPKWGGNEVEQLIYPTEDAEVLALRRLPAWKRQLEEKDDAPLDELLRRAVAGVSPAEFSAAGEVRARERAAADVKALGERRAALRREFLEAGGWTVVLETFDPVFPQAFDPWNVERVSESEVLHTRWVKLGNSAGSVEVLDRKCLTEGAGKHPLFDGVRRATLTGLAAEPRLEETADGVRLATDGVNLDFRGARISRTGHTVTITVPRSPPSPTATPSSPGYSSDSDVPSPGSVGSASPIERADPSLRSG